MEEENKVLQEVEQVEGAEAEQTDKTETVSFEELMGKVGEIQQALVGLQHSFDEKIAEDEYKNGLFDNMHQELVDYKNGAMDKIVDMLLLDIIQLIDAYKKKIRIYEEKEPTEENYGKLLKVLKDLIEDLGDALYRQNVEPYNVAGQDVDVRRQKIIQNIPTDDESKNNMLAERIADGYEKAGRVLRPERIKIYKYEETADNTAENE